MIFINDTQSLASKAFVRDVFTKIKPVLTHVDADWLADAEADVEFFGDLHLTELSANAFHVVFNAIAGAQVDSAWQQKTLDAMKQDPRIHARPAAA